MAMETFKLILSLLLGFAKSLVWGILFLIIALIVLPERILLKILNKFKPDLVSKNKILMKAKLFCDFIFNNKAIVFETTSSESKNFQEDLTELMKEKRLIESNLFFLDLLKNLSNIIFFSSSQLGGNERDISNLLNGSMEYLIYYSHQLKSSRTSQNIQQRIDLKAESLQNQLTDLINFLNQENSENQIQTAQISLKQGIASFNDFMKSEYDSAYENLRNINKLIAKNFISFLEEK